MKRRLLILTAPPMLMIAFMFAACNESVTAPDAASAATDETFSKQEEDTWGEVIELDDSDAFFEFNTTDNDLGLQIFLDGEGWSGMRVNDANQDRILDIKAKGPLGELGITELRFESSEPSPEEVLANFPPGEYLFTGRTPEGGRLIGDSELSHYFAPAPTMSPAHGAEVDPDNVIVTWTAPEAELVEVIIESEDSDATFDIIVEADVTSLTVPPQFLDGGVEYKLEILSYHENGNRTIAETTFVTSDD